MGFAVTAFLAIFVLIASGGLLLFYREAMLQRITEVINPSAKKKKGLLGQIQESGFSVGNIVEHFNSVIPKSQAEVSVVKARLIRAGYRTESAIRMFNGAKFLTPIACCAIAWATGLYKFTPFFVYACCIGLGFLLPDFWLSNRI